MRLVDDLVSSGSIYCKDGVSTMSHETFRASFEERVCEVDEKK